MAQEYLENRVILESFKGKEISGISCDPRFELTIKFTDGSILNVQTDGPEGSHIAVGVTVFVSKNF